MKILPLTLLTALAFAACNKPEAKEESDTPPPAPKNTPVATRPPTASPTPVKDWMWKDEKGKQRDTDPLGVKNNGLERAKKK